MEMCQSKNDRKERQRKALALVFNARQKRNSRYSMRSFARDLKLNPGTLSSIIQGKRAIPARQVPKVARLIEDVPGACEFLTGAGVLARVPLASIVYEIVADWEYTAILTILESTQIVPKPPEIARQLRIPIGRVNECLGRLIEAKLVIGQSDGSFCVAKVQLETSEDIVSKALQDSHRQNLDIAGKKIAEVPIEERDFSSLTFLMSKKSLPQAKKLIRQFRARMQDLFEDRSSTDVYNLCIQFFPTNQKGNRKEST